MGLARQEGARDIPDAAHRSAPVVLAANKGARDNPDAARNPPRESNLMRPAWIT